MDQGRSWKYRKWVQLKIRPSWLENRVECCDMYCGSTVYIFKAKYTNGVPCNFFTLICYDWVAADSGTTVYDEVLMELNRQWTETLTPLDWAFIIQHNKFPNHYLFIDNTYNFLSDYTKYQYIDRRNAGVLHANTAVSVKPSKSGNGAFTSCVFSPSAQMDCTACRPTVCMRPDKLRNIDKLNRCKDVVFREMGECIHLFKVRIPRFIRPDAADRTLPLPEASVYAINSEICDPRLCGSAVPAIVKWVNDSLDSINSIRTNILLNCSLNLQAETVQIEIISDLRTLNHSELDKGIKYATASFTLGRETRDIKQHTDKDSWDGLELNALENVVYALTILGLAYKCTVKEAKLHGRIALDETTVHIVAIRGDTYEDCRRHYDAVVQKPIGDIVLAIFQDRNNLKPLQGEFKRITDAKSDNFMITDYHSLVTCCRESKNSETLRRYIDDIITHEHRII